jgi:hypothetical protein
MLSIYPRRDDTLDIRCGHQFQLVTSFGVANASMRATRQHKTDETPFEELHLATLELFSDSQGRLAVGVSIRSGDGLRV